MNTLVKITKLASVESPLFNTPSKEEYNNGELNENVSLPIEYNVEGYLLSDLQLDKCVKVLRQKRNGIEIGGLFMTSPVTEITATGFKTLNSVYLMEIL